MEHPVFTRIIAEGFTPFGWFTPRPGDRAPEGSNLMLLIGNAGPSMFRRFARERDPEHALLDDWCRAVIDPLARQLGAHALYPFDKPPHPFLTWAQRAGCGHASPLGLNIHPTYGLWHAFRAALIFDLDPGLPPLAPGAHPCTTCIGRPCLTACPVDAFTGESYRIDECIRHIASPAGEDCMLQGCLARRACPIGQNYRYTDAQIGFHMHAFRRAHTE
jgi:ferredoxin